MILTREKKLFILKRHRLTDFFFMNMSAHCSLCLILCQFFCRLFFQSCDIFMYSLSLVPLSSKFFFFIIHGYDNNEHQQQEYLIVKGFFFTLCSEHSVVFTINLQINWRASCSRFFILFSYL